MQKLINSQAINKNGWQAVYLTDVYNLLSVFDCLPTSSFKYCESNSFLAGYTQYNLSGVRKNEQSRNRKPKLELGFKDCALQTRNQNLSWGVAL